MQNLNVFFRRIIGIFALIFTLSSTPALLAQESYTIDSAHSSIEFKVRHLGVSWVSGAFRDFVAQGVFDPSAPEKSKIEVTVQSKSVSTGNDKRDKHLLGPDYFDVEKYPTISFTSTQVKKTSENHYQVTGNLTLLATTKPITFDVESTDVVTGPKGEFRRGGEATFKVKRSEYGLTKSVGPVGDEVQLSISFSGVKK